MFLAKPDVISEFAETKEYDVVVVGAGNAGIAAVHSALEAGASVACVQNTEAVFTTGSIAASIDLSKTSEAAIQACETFINYKSDYRSDRNLVDVWARNSQEAIEWWKGAAAEKGVEPMTVDSVVTSNGYDIHVHAYLYRDGGYNTPATAIAESLQESGAEFFFSTPAVQLEVVDGSVTGVICQNADGDYVLFKASKGVILATGDYSGNREMLDFYAPDTKGFNAPFSNRDGSGLCMGIWAGAVMCPVNHTKMIHGEDAAFRLEMPFLFVDNKGKRFMCEDCCRMGYLNNFMRPYMAEAGYSNHFAAKFFSIVLTNWEECLEQWKGNPNIVAENVDQSKWLTGNTVEELVDSMNSYMEEMGWGIDPLSADAVKETIDRYNELCSKGEDDDFGKSADYLVPIDGKPYYAVPRGSNSIPAILGGLIINADNQCLDESGQPIPGLFAIGNASGQFYGGVDYPMDIGGLSVGRCITSGYVAGKYVASL